MAHIDDCETCQRLDASEVVVEVHETDTPAIRRFSAHPWPVDTEQRFSSAGEADTHPLARALWRNGTVAIVLDAQGATVERVDERAWPFYGDGMATSLREQITLL
jgi:hypothetical protein